LDADAEVSSFSASVDKTLMLREMLHVCRQ